MFRNSGLIPVCQRSYQRGEALMPPESSDDELMVEEAQIVPFEDA